MRRILLVGGLALVGLPILLVAIIWAGANTEAGRRALANLVNSLIAEHAVIEGLGGAFPQQLTLARLTLKDEAGPWLVAADLRLEWSPTALFDRRLAIDELSARRITVLRPPSDADGDQRLAAEQEAGQVFQPPRLPLDISIKRLAVDEVALDEAAIGLPARLSVLARAELPRGGAGLDLALDAQRTDQPGRARIELSHDFQRDLLKLDLNISEPPDGLIVRTLDIPGRPPVGITASASGPLDGLAIEVRAEAGTDARLNAHIDLKRDKGVHFATTGTARLAALAPADWRALLASPIDFSAKGAFEADLLQIEILRLAHADATVEARGTLDTDSSAADFQADLTANAAPFIEASSKITGDARLAGRVEAKGPIARPAVEVRLSATDISLETFAAASASVSGTLNPKSAKEWTLALTGDVDRPALSGEPLPLLAGQARFEFNGDVDLDRERVNITTARVRSDEIAVDVRGELGVDGLGELDGRVALSRLEAVGAVAGLDIGGSASVEFHVAPAGQADLFAVSGNATFAELRPGDAFAEALLGPAPRVAFAATVGAGQPIAFETLTITGDVATADGRLNLDADLQEIDATVAIAVSDLAPLSSIVGAGLAGRMTAEGTLAGPTDSPRTKFTFLWPDAILEGQALGTVHGKADLNDLFGSPGGPVEIAAAPFGRALTIGGDLALDDDTLRLANLSIGGDLTGRGALAVDLDRALITGEAAIDSTDIRPWASAFALDLAGVARITTRLQANENSQRVHLLADITTPTMTVPTAVRADAFSIDLTIDDAFARPTATGKLLGEGVQSGDLPPLALSVDVTRLSETGVEEVKFMVTDPGDLFLVQGAAAAEWKKGVSVRLVRLNGTFYELPVRLTQALHITVDGPRLAVEGLRLDAAGGRIEGDAVLGPDLIKGALAVHALPLDLLERFDLVDDMSGYLDLHASLGGKPSAPVGEAKITARDIRFAYRDLPEDLPPGQIDIAMLWRDGLVKVDGGVRGLPETRVELTGQLPAIGDFRTWRFQIPTNRPAKVKLSAAADIEAVAPFLPLDGDRLHGRLDLEIDGTGTIDALDFTARGGLTNGYYESARTGAMLQDITISVTGQPGLVAIEEVRATDGGGGTLEGSGRITFDKHLLPEFDVGLMLNSIRVTGLDELVTVASGKLTLVGDLNEMLLSGQITIVKLDFEIPRRLATSVPTIEVKEINGPGGVTVEKRIESEPSDIRLDVTVVVPGQAFVRGRSLDSEWKGSVRAFGSANPPTLEGQMSIVRGRMTLAGKAFRIETGEITFTPTRRGDTDVTIRFEATAEAADIVAKISATGPVTDPDFELTSTPELPRDEILARVLYGKSASELTPGQALEIARTALELSGRIGGPGLMTDIRRSLGLDQLEFGSTDSDATGLDSASVRAGKYITDDVFIRVEQGISDKSSNVGVEYEILPQVTIETSVGADAQSNVGVRFQYKY